MKSENNKSHNMYGTRLNRYIKGLQSDLTSIYITIIENVLRCIYLYEFSLFSAIGEYSAR